MAERDTTRFPHSRQPVILDAREADELLEGVDSALFRLEYAHSISLALASLLKQTMAATPGEGVHAMLNVVADDIEDARVHLERFFQTLGGEYTEHGDRIM